MAVKRSYNRYFIIFQEEDRGFGMAIDKQPTGYTKIETRNGRCKITSYVQNLLKDRGPYVCCMIDSTQNPPVLARLGEVKVDDTGRGETWWEFKEDDIAGTGIPFDRFNVAAVIVEGDRMYAPLAGYMGRERIPWKDRLVQAPRSSDDEALKAAKKEEVKEEEMDEEAKKFKEYEEKISKGEFEKEKPKDAALKPVEKPKDTDSKEKPKDAGSKPAEKPKEAAKEKGEADKSTGSKGKDETKPNDPAFKAKSDTKQNEPANKAASSKDTTKLYSPNENIEDNEIDPNMTRTPKKNPYFSNNFHNVLNKYQEVDIGDEKKGSKWWRIPYDEDTFIDEDENYPYCCSIYHLQMTYPYINYVKYFRKRGYYYFGLNYDEDGEVKQIMYGIEGNSTPKEQPYMGMTGFIKWLKMKDGDTGLWVMYYNPYTGCVMIPKKR